MSFGIQGVMRAFIKSAETVVITKLFQTRRNCLHSGVLVVGHLKVVLLPILLSQFVVISIVN